MKNATPNQRLQLIYIIIKTINNIFSSTFEGKYTVSGDIIYKINEEYQKILDILNNINIEDLSNDLQKNLNNIKEFLPPDILDLSECNILWAEPEFNLKHKIESFIHFLEFNLNKENIIAKIYPYNPLDESLIKIDELLNEYIILKKDAIDSYIKNNTLEVISKKHSSFFYLDNESFICHYQKGRLKLPTKNIPLYYNTLAFIIKTFPNDITEISISEFNKNISKNDVSKLKLKGKAVYKNRFSSAGRSFQKFLSENDIVNTNPINKQKVIEATATKLTFNNRVE